MKLMLTPSADCPRNTNMNELTGMAGKWRQVGDTPGDWGFDEWLTDPTAGGWFWKTSYTKNGQLVEMKEDVSFKLTQRGELFDMSDAPFVEQPVAADSQDAAATAARARLQGVLDKLSPATGKLPAPGEKKIPAGKKKRQRKQA
jgi:hypothetical protein